MPAQKPLSLERIFASPDLAGSQPRAMKLSPDGKLVTLLRNRANDKDRFDLWAIDTVTGKERMLVDSLKLGSGAALSEAEKMQRERARIGGTRGIVSYDWSPDGKRILVPLDGELFLAALEGEAVRLGAAGALNPAVSPKGRYLSFVRGGNMVVLDIATRQEKQLTQGASDTVSWGVAEFVAQEEMDRQAGYWWSPDDAHIAVARVDESGVAIVNRAAIGAEGTKIYPQRYPLAGTANAVVELYVMDPLGERQVKVDLGEDKDIYLARVDWAKDGKTLYVQRESRDQKRLDLLAVDPATGAAKVILTETAKTWLNLHNNFRALADGSFLWWSEKSGNGHLYHVSGTKWTALTSGAWQVRDVIGLDEKRGVVWFTGNRETPLEQHVYSAPLSGKGEVKLLTEPGWWNGGVMDSAAGRIIVSRSSPEQPVQLYLADKDGKRLRWLSENALDGAHPYAPYRSAHVHTVFGSIKAKDGSDLFYKLLTPKLEPGKRYPVFMIHYGGPGAGRQVTRAWGGVLQQYLVQRGWIVFAIDNRGTPDRGKAFEDEIHRAMGGVEVEDQLAGVDWLKAQPFVDPKRIATYGWSYGGYMTLKLLQKAPGVFAAGIAGAPVTKWELYDTHYTERYLGDPNAKRSAYPASNALADVAQISDPLLLLHGMADDNVVLEHSTAFMTAMQEAGRPFELMLYPGQTHRFAGEGVNVHEWRTIERFLAKVVAGD
ncbi:DPP IV N-terminal domain-containing protein [Sphingobium sp. DEHP117]|uniref:S9 family peptidase n=1 Tax=Sphingobium sp. DEHP117 TaxID=2993436 RepID=UPI0027D69E55|nr:DPP IV N-terminal domain-containing protein [Sphingobium sp. DEHP117]MDQ4419550.1 DPP IV N-terminal domain-containing protein [Sphingobium sp. DEHP117]